MKTVIRLAPVLATLAGSTASEPADDPAGLLRLLAGERRGREAACARLADEPARLLDAIFLPAGSDAPDPALLRLAARWIPRLGAERYPDRIEAERKLREAGPGVRPALKRALDDPSPEVRLRAGLLLGEFRDHPALAELDYGTVVDSVEAIAKGIRSNLRLEQLALRACRRFGTRTVHQQEARLIRPLFEEIVARDTRDAPRFLLKVLQSPHPEIVDSVVEAVRRATAQRGLNRCYLELLATNRPEVLDRVLATPPRDPGDDDPLLPAYRDILERITGTPALPEPARLRAHRLLLLHFSRGDSLQAIVDAAAAGESEIAPLVLTDPRLVGLPLPQAEHVAELIHQSDQRVLAAAAAFLMTRPDGDCPRLGVTFLPSLDKPSVGEIGRIIGDLVDPSALRRELLAEVSRRGPGTRLADELLSALPEQPLLAVPESPFGFR